MLTMLRVAARGPSADAHELRFAVHVRNDNRERTLPLALAFSFAVEFSQLYHAPWIDALRGYRLGTLVLGDTVGWGDLAA
jgi:hypothetical protein